MYLKKAFIINSKINKEGYGFSDKKFNLGSIFKFVITKGKEKHKKYIGCLVKEKNKNYVRLDGSICKLNNKKVIILDNLKKKEKIYKLLNIYRHKEYLPLEIKLKKKINWGFRINLI